MHKSTLIRKAASRREPAGLPVPGRLTRPGGLYLVCAVELFERLGSAMVFSLGVLYLNEYLGLGTGAAARASSYLHMLSYAAGIAGGMLGDRVLGTRSAARAGLMLLALGYAALGYVQRSAAGLLAGALLVIAGSGLFKPNCTAVLGTLDAPGHPRRVQAYYWFYYAINFGSMLAPCIGGLMRAALGWGAMFRLAAGFVVIGWGLSGLWGRTFGGGGSAAEAAPPLASEPAIPAGQKPACGSQTGSLLFVLAVLAVFGAALSQSYGTLLLWARDDARRRLMGYAIPPDFFAALPAVFVLGLGPLLARFTTALAARGVRLSDGAKFTAGMLLCALGYAVMLVASLLTRPPALASPLWVVGCKSALALGELLGVPVALARAESLASARTKGLALGLSYGAHALGFWLGGEISSLWPTCPHTVFFALLMGCCVMAALRMQARQRQAAGALSLC